MDRTLGGGVPYLSREEIELLSEHSFSGGRAEVEPVDVSSLVSFDRCFYERLVETLRAWLASKPKPVCVRAAAVCLPACRFPFANDDLLGDCLGDSRASRRQPSTLDDFARQPRCGERVPAVPLLATAHWRCHERIASRCKETR